MNGSPPLVIRWICQSNKTAPARPETIAKGLKAIHPRKNPARPRRARTGDQASAQSLGSQNIPPQIPGGNFKYRIKPKKRLANPKVPATISTPFN
jgi:hypothetical protein